MSGLRLLVALALGFTATSAAWSQDAPASRPAGSPRDPELQIAVEVRFAWLSERVLELLGERLAPLAREGRDADAPVALKSALSDKQLADLLALLHSDRTANLMQAPKLTLTNGQQATVQVGEEQWFLTGIDMKAGGYLHPQQEAIFLGHRHTLRPTVEPNGDVRLAVNIQFSELAGPVPLIPVQFPVPRKNGQADVFQAFVQQPTVTRLTLDQTFRIADHHTQVASVGRVTKEVRSETGVPVLAKVPYVSRLFRNVGYGRETQYLLVFLTPRVLDDAMSQAR